MQIDWNTYYYLNKKKEKKNTFGIVVELIHCARWQTRMEENWNIFYLKIRIKKMIERFNSAFLSQRFFPKTIKFILYS